MVTDGIIVFDDLLEYELGKLTIHEKIAYCRRNAVYTLLTLTLMVLSFGIAVAFRVFELMWLILGTLLLVVLCVQIIHIISYITYRYYLTAFLMDKDFMWENGGRRYYFIGKSLSSDYSRLFPVKKSVYRMYEKGDVVKIPIKESWMNEIYINGRRMRVPLLNILKSEVEKRGIDKVREESEEDYYQKSYFQFLVESSISYMCILTLLLTVMLTVGELWMIVIALFWLSIPIFCLPRPWRYRIDLPNTDTAEGLEVYYKGKKVELDGRIENGKFLWNHYTQRHKGIKYSDSQTQIGIFEASRLSSYLEIILRKKKLFKHNGGIWTD